MLLILIDMQNGFLQSSETKKLVKKTADLLSLGIFDTVIATKFVNVDDSPYERYLDWHEMKTEEEQEIPQEIIDNVDYIVEKQIYNCVDSSFLSILYKACDWVLPQQVFLAGVDTDCCVLTIATALFENSIRPIVLTEYVASNGGIEAHEAGLKCLRRLIGEQQLVSIIPHSVKELEEVL